MKNETYTAKELMEIALIEIERMTGLERKRDEEKSKEEAFHACFERKQRP